MSKRRDLDPKKMPTDIADPGAWKFKYPLGEWFQITDIPRAGEVLKGIFAMHHDGCYSGVRIRRPEGWEPKECPTCGSPDKGARLFVAPPGMPHAGQECPDLWHDEPKAPKIKEIILNGKVFQSDDMSPSEPGLSISGRVVVESEPKAPTHEGTVKKTCVGIKYLTDCEYAILKENGHGCAFSGRCEAQRPYPFTNRQSADIPPEATP